MATKTVFISTVVLVNEHNEILIARRPSGKDLAGYWEIPGGKFEPGETAQAAAIREMKEELGIDIAEADLSPFTFLSIEYDAFALVMLVYLTHTWQGAPTPLENQEIAWVSAGELHTYPVPPADIPLIKQLKDRFAAKGI